MSLKGFHLLFIICSIILLIGFGYWAIVQYREGSHTGLLITAIVTFLLSIGLIIYGIRFSKKILIALLAILWTNLSLANVSFACSVCFGNQDSPLADGLKAGILVLLVVLSAVLILFAKFFLNIRKKTKLLSKLQ